MNTAVNLVLHPPTVLCERCQAFNFTEWFYPMPEASNTYGPPHDLDLATTLDNQQVCTFCALIMCALALDPRFSLMQLGGPDIVAGKIMLQKAQIGTVRLLKSSSSDQADWPNKLRGWQQKGQMFERVVNQITLGSLLRDEAGKTVKMLSPISITPMCTGKERIYDRLLHHTTQCSNKIDLNLVRGWMTSCSLNHQSTCPDLQWHDMGSAHLRMVDLQEEHVVQIKHQVRYLALSYCWGAPKQIKPHLQLNSQTREYLERKGAISDVLLMLPQTIQDAMQLTGDLGFRYLWVDALCIVQDNGTHKMSQIRQMDKIYSHADITIVAAAGIDAWRGLPGLREGTRFTRSLSQEIGDMTLLAKWPSTYFPSTVPPEWSWSKRCWTFQEQICSKRLLIFTDEEVMWECNTELLTEGANPTTASGLSHLSVSLKQNRNLGMKPDSTLSPLQLYNFYMAGTSTRRLGYEEDRLNSAAGLLRTLEASFSSGFIWGLPIDVFDCAMLFHCGVWDTAPFERRSMFPSWCWAAHKCHARSSIAGPYWSGFSNAFKVQGDSFRAEKNAFWIRKEVAFHRISEDGLTWVNLHSTQITEDGSIFYRSSLERWETSEAEALLTEAKSRLDVLDIPHNHALACFVQIVDLDVDRSEKDRFLYNGIHPSWGYSVRSPLGKYICGLRLTEDYRKAQPDKLKFILIAQQRRWEHLFGPLFELILVEQRVGLTFRIQIGCESMLTLDLWNQLAPRWEAVVLV